MEETKELIALLYDMQNAATYNNNVDFINKQKKIMNDVDYLDVIVNALNSEVDNLISSMDTIEEKLGI